MNLIKNKPTAQPAADGIEQLNADAVNASYRRELYKKREPIYPKRINGTFRTLKWAFLVIALSVYYFIPFVRWDRGPEAPSQAVLVDFAHARFYFFFIEIWPQEIYYISGLMILASFFLFFITSLFGRVWCGYACPQTVWTDLFLFVERRFEGDRNRRIKMARAPWSFDKAWRKIGKHTVWLLIAAATGGAWILYFHDAFEVVNNFIHGQAALTSYIFFALLTFTTYTLAGTMREQVCTYMCPWPRIQGALTDREALNVTYRVDRGEPRGRHKKGDSWEGRGDCIDCKACIAVCPVGIDIRDGAQLECIGCALCIDACNEIMVKIGRPKGLIAYDTDDNIERREAGQPTRYRFLRPRTLLYVALISVVGSIMLFSLINRTELELNSFRDRNPNYVTLSDGTVRNGYTLTVVNKSNQARNLLVSIEGNQAIDMRILGTQTGSNMVAIPADQTRDFRIYLSIPEHAIEVASERVVFVVTDPRTSEIAKTNTVLQTGEFR